jgi:hypothetical protein
MPTKYNYFQQQERGKAQSWSDPFQRLYCGLPVQMGQAP